MLFAIAVLTVYKIFTNYLRFLFDFPFEHEHNSLLSSLTSMASSPIHSILHHGITNSSFSPNIENPLQGLTTVKDKMLAQSISNSNFRRKSETFAAAKIYHLKALKIVTWHFSHIITPFFVIICKESSSVSPLPCGADNKKHRGIQKAIYGQYKKLIRAETVRE